MLVAMLLTKDKGIDDMRIPFVFRDAGRQSVKESKEQSRRRIRREQAHVVPPGSRTRTAEEAAAAMRNPANPFDAGRKKLMEDTGASSPLAALVELDEQREAARDG